MPLDGNPQVYGLPVLHPTLEAAAHLIEQRGWCQGIGMDDKYRICANSALAIAAGFGTADPADILRFGFANGGAIASWNDVPGRTEEQVLRRLRSRARGLVEED